MGTDLIPNLAVKATIDKIVKRQQEKGVLSPLVASFLQHKKDMEEERVRQEKEEEEKFRTDLLQKAEAGGAAATTAMGQLFEFYTKGSNGFPKDYKEAIRWMKRGTEAGSANCMFGFGFSLVRGFGNVGEECFVEQNIPFGIHLITRAAALNSALANRFLGFAYMPMDEIGKFKQFAKFGIPNLGFEKNIHMAKFYLSHITDVNAYWKGEIDEWLAEHRDV